MKYAQATYSPRCKREMRKNALRPLRDIAIITMYAIAISACVFYSFDGITF